MKKWYYWLLLAAIWCVAGIVNYFDGRTNYYLFQIVIFLMWHLVSLFVKNMVIKEEKYLSIFA